MESGAKIPQAAFPLPLVHMSINRAKAERLVLNDVDKPKPGVDTRLPSNACRMDPSNLGW